MRRLQIGHFFVFFDAGSLVGPVSFGEMEAESLVVVIPLASRLKPGLGYLDRVVPMAAYT